MVQPSGMQGKENLGKPGKLNKVPVILGHPNMTIPEPLPPHLGQPTRIGTMVGSLEPSDVVVIHVLVVHSGWSDIVVGDQPAGSSVIVEVTGPVEIGPLPDETEVRVEPELSVLV